MKVTPLLLVAVLTLAGCRPATDQTGDTSPTATRLDPLVGQWASDGELALIIERIGEELVIRNPPNETWRFEISDIESDGSTITFTQRSYVADGTDHPFNGVPCKYTIMSAPDDPDSLNYTLTSPQIPDGVSNVFTRLKK